MKRILALILALLVLAGPLAAAEQAARLSGSTLPENVFAAADLDGDGMSEQVCWTMAEVDEYDSLLTLRVLSADGQAVEHQAEIRSSGHVYILDLDGDGRLEILITGDEMSDDYITQCLHFDGGALHEVLFPDCDRGENGGGYYAWGYGLITGISGDTLILEGSQDVLGTWMATRMVRLTPYERFEFCDGGLWELKASDPEEIEALWQYHALTVTAPIAYTGAGGSPSGTLQRGDRILVHATDKRERAWFVTKSGTRGVLAISEDCERGWGMLVNGVPETECFEYLPYAD